MLSNSLSALKVGLSSMLAADSLLFQFPRYARIVRRDGRDEALVVRVTRESVCRDKHGCYVIIVLIVFFSFSLLFFIKTDYC